MFARPVSRLPRSVTAVSSLARNVRPFSRYIDNLYFGVAQPTKEVPEFALASLSQNEKTVNVKTPEEMIAEVPVIYVQGNTAICTGGDEGMGHPIEYIQLNTVKKGAIATCKYCGLRFSNALQ
mmetsp:Transcript_22298/g.31508  ORF Transcript_22298/g.31508 Transcript_22298/m.31508 type:complete len:123 (-) Transcript_22298:150-518(-)